MWVFLCWVFNLFEYEICVEVLSLSRAGYLSFVIFLFFLSVILVDNLLHLEVRIMYLVGFFFFD